MTKAIAIIGFTLALEAGFLLQTAIPAHPQRVVRAATVIAGQPPANGFALRPASATTLVRPRS